jgi:hypothetical protein
MHLCIQVWQARVDHALVCIYKHTHIHMHAYMYAKEHLMWKWGRNRSTGNAAAPTCSGVTAGKETTVLECWKSPLEPYPCSVGVPGRSTWLCGFCEEQCEFTDLIMRKITRALSNEGIRADYARIRLHQGHSGTQDWKTMLLSQMAAGTVARSGIWTECPIYTVPRWAGRCRTTTPWSVSSHSSLFGSP